MQIGIGVSKTCAMAFYANQCRITAMRDLAVSLRSAAEVAGPRLFGAIDRSHLRHDTEEAARSTLGLGTGNG